MTAPHGRSSTSQRRILVADDDVEHVARIRDTLERDGGHEVMESFHGADALIRAGRERPDLILLDVAMPGLDGFEVCRRLKLREETRGIPVIILTASAGQAEIVYGFKVGAASYLVKPVDSEKLLAAVDQCLLRDDVRGRLEKRIGSHLDEERQGQGGARAVPEVEPLPAGPRIAPSLESARESFADLARLVLQRTVDFHRALEDESVRSSGPGREMRRKLTLLENLCRDILEIDDPAGPAVGRRPGGSSDDGA